MDSICLYGNDRAVVTCIVTMKPPAGAAAGEKPKCYHNLRLLVRRENEETQVKEWPLVGWANEPV